jgi:hypothetical protein
LQWQLDPLAFEVITAIIATIVSIVAIIISDTKTTRCSDSLLTHDTITHHDGSTPSHQRCMNTLLAHNTQHCSQAMAEGPLQ